MAELDSLATEVLKRCKTAGIMLSTVESCTGGMVAATLTGIPGASAVVERSFITYSNEAKVELVGIPMQLIINHGAVSEPVARAMAEGALAYAPVDLAIGITGIAGPGRRQTDKPEGLVHFACARRGCETVHTKTKFGVLGRSEVRYRSVIQALRMLRDAAAQTPT